MSRRRTPFDLFFASTAEEIFGPIRDEELSRDLRATEPGEFAKLGSAQDLIRRLDPTTDAEEQTARPEEVEQYVNLIFATYSFWRAGRQTKPIDAEALTVALNSGEMPEIPGETCYLQLPEHAYWGRVEPQAAWEPLDGLYVVPAESGSVLVVAILGLHEKREGLSQLAVNARTQDLHIASRERRSPPFAPAMDGGELAGFKSVLNNAELLDLTSLALRCVNN